MATLGRPFIIFCFRLSCGSSHEGLAVVDENGLALELVDGDVNFGIELVDRREIAGRERTVGDILSPWKARRTDEAFCFIVSGLLK